MNAMVIAAIVVALVFGFINGSLDAASSITTLVSTRVLSPYAAVAWAALFNFIAFALFQTAVATSIATSVDASVITENVVFSTLIGAVACAAISWFAGLGLSSSHSLMGAIAGAAIARDGSVSVLNASVWGKAAVFIVAAPLLGALIGLAAMKLSRALGAAWTPSRVNSSFRGLQLVSAALNSLGHGANDAQKTMGVIIALLALHRPAATVTPDLWVLLACHAVMGLGTLWGGLRAVRTMRMKVARLKPLGSFCVDTAGAITLLIASVGGVPVSTTHTNVGAMVGVGAGARRLNATRWGVTARNIGVWALTIPAAAAMSAVVYSLLRAASGRA